MKLKKLINQYLDYVKFEKNRSENTLKSYRRYLELFLDFAGNIKTGRISYKIVREFKKKQIKRGCSINYLNSISMCLRAFFRYANIHNIPCINSLLVEIGQRQPKIAVFLERGEIRRLLKAPDTTTLKGLRDRAILETLISTGLRVGELVKIEKNQIGRRSSTTIIGKGKVVRIIFFSKRAKKWIDKYLRARNDDSSLLFPLTKRSIERMIKVYSKIAEITKDVSPHTLRHSLAVNLLENGADIFHIKEILGHKDIGTTQRYLHITNKRLKDIHNKFHRL